MKGLTAFSDKNTENVCVTNTVFWCDWGKNLDIGLATACSEIKNITWRDCDIIHNSSSCIAISNGQWADINGVLYENIRVEYSKHTLPQVLQKHDGESYDAKGQSSVPVLIAISDKRRNWQGNIASESEKAKIRNVCFNGIYVVSDRDKKPEIKIKKFTELSSFENIELKNIFFNSEAWESDLF
jgi:hypothetical protein